MMSPERIAESRRATERARAVLKPGDRLRISRCGGAIVTVTFAGFDPTFTSWICSKTLDDIHAMHISKVNGIEVSFADPPGFIPPRVSIRQRVTPHIRRLRLQLIHWRAIYLPSIEWSAGRGGTSRTARIYWYGKMVKFTVRYYSFHDEVPF